MTNLMIFLFNSNTVTRFSLPYLNVDSGLFRKKKKEIKSNMFLSDSP